MLYVSVLLASFYHSLLFLSHTSLIRTYMHTHLFTLFCLIRSFSVTLLLLSLTFSLSLSHDTLMIDYATSWQIRIVLATVSYSRTRRLSPIANYIRSLLHLGELRASRGGFSIPAGRARDRRGGVRGGQGPSTWTTKAVIRLLIMCDSRIGAIKLFELTRDDSH